MVDQSSPDIVTYINDVEMRELLSATDVGKGRAILRRILAMRSPDAAATPTVPVDAIVNLVNHQQQCDMDGVMVQVSRQALAEVLLYVTEVRPDNKWAGGVAQSAWQPIETAPKDGTWLLVWETEINTKYHPSEIARFQNNRWESSAMKFVNAVAWQPAPAGPPITSTQRQNIVASDPSPENIDPSPEPLD